MVSNGLVLLGKQTTGSLTEIPSGSSAEIQSTFVFGIGRISIMVTAQDAEKTVSALLLGPFLLLRE
jgi:hypothetical protein